MKNENNKQVLQYKNLLICTQLHAQRINFTVLLALS